jgi:hypothetical protein
MPPEGLEWLKLSRLATITRRLLNPKRIPCRVHAIPNMDGRHAAAMHPMCRNVQL